MSASIPVTAGEKKAQEQAYLCNIEDVVKRITELHVELGAARKVARAAYQEYKRLDDASVVIGLLIEALKQRLQDEL